MHSPSQELRAAFGEIDIYLFDQILKGRFDARRRVLDAGCGDGRNLIYFLRSGFDCFAVDEDERAVAEVRRLAASLAPGLPSDHIVELPPPSHARGRGLWLAEQLCDRVDVLPTADGTRIALTMLR